MDVRMRAARALGRWVWISGNLLIQPTARTSWTFSRRNCGHLQGRRKVSWKNGLEKEDVGEGAGCHGGSGSGTTSLSWSEERVLQMVSRTWDVPRLVVDLVEVDSGEKDASVGLLVNLHLSASTK